MKNELLMAFIAATLEKMPDEWGEPRELSGMDVIETLCSLNDVFRPRLLDIVDLPYDKNLEAEADKAIEAFIGGEGEAAWNNLPLGVWRVLSERHTTSIIGSQRQRSCQQPAYDDTRGFAGICLVMRCNAVFNVSNETPLSCETTIHW